MKKLLVSTLVLALTGCASAPKAVAPAQAKGKDLEYKVSAKALDEYRSSRCNVVAKTASYPDHVKAAAACAGAGQWSRVDEIGNMMSINNPSEPWGPYFLSVAAEGNRDLSRARWMAELAVKKAPNEGIVLYQLGRIQWLMDEKDAAAATFQKAAEKNPTLNDGNVFLGRMALLQDKTSEATRRFTQVYGRDSSNIGALLGLAELAVRKNNWIEAEKYLRQAAQAGSSNGEVAAKIRAFQSKVAEQVKATTADRKSASEGKVSK